MRHPLLSACLVALAAAACDPSTGPDPTLASGDDPAATVFLAQDAPPPSYMEALYRGRVVRDAQGCLRLEGAETSTVIWPYGFTLEARDDGLYVKNAEDEDVGRVGGSFHMGGGFVPLDYVEHLSDQKRALATSRCPGGYWVAGEFR